MKSTRVVIASLAAFAFAGFASVATAQPAAAPAPAAAAAPAKPEQVKIAHVSPGKISWKGGNRMKSHTGTFENWHFTKVAIPDGDITKGTVEFEIDLGSITSDADKLTTHLKSGDFFGVTEFPKATVALANAKATDKTADGKQNYTAEGTIAMRGVSAPLKVNFTVESAKPLIVKGAATVDRDAIKVGKPSDPNEAKSIHKEVAVEFAATIPETVVAPKLAAPAAK